MVTHRQIKGMGEMLNWKQILSQYITLWNHVNVLHTHAKLNKKCIGVDEERTVFLTNGARTTGYPHAKGLNVRAKTIKFLEGNR